MKNNKLHLRKCVSCNMMKHKDELFRVVRINTSIYFDPTYKLNGRGAYVCRNSNCLALATKKNLFSRSLKTRVSDEIYSTLLMEQENGNR